MEKMKGKDWDQKEAPKVHKELVETMANMELRLPVTWNKHVRHCLACLFIPQLNDYGSFWASAMLWVEFYHTLGLYCFHIYCFRTVFVLYPYCFRTYCFRTIFVLFPYCFRTVFVL